MSDYHEMFENWGDAVREYDPDYPIADRVDDEHVKPVNPDDWANNDDLEGGF